jgi:hypothetical protein
MKSNKAKQAGKTTLSPLARRVLNGVKRACIEGLDLAYCRQQRANCWTAVKSREQAVTAIKKAHGLAGVIDALSAVTAAEDPDQISEMMVNDIIDWGSNTQVLGKLLEALKRNGIDLPW